jgi:hypothetical protein
MPLVDFYASDPGLEILVANTKINLIEKLALGVRFAQGRGTVGYVAAVVDDRGVPTVPYQMSSTREFETLLGGFLPWMGDAVPAGVEGTLAEGHFEDRGANSGYLGNGLALDKGLDAPIVVLQVPDLALKDDSIGAATPGVDVPVLLTRAAATYGRFTLPAGTRISDGAVGTPYVVATLEKVTWDEDETGDKSVRVRQVSPQSTVAVPINTVDTFVDDPLDDEVTVATTAVTEPELMTTAEITLRYEDALTHLLDNAPGRLVELVVADRTEAGIGDAVAQHCLDASAQGFFRLCGVAPPLGTTATDAKGTTGDGVGRTTLQRAYASYCHPGWRRQFRTDSDHLNAAEEWQANMPSHAAWIFLAAQRRPEENPARPHPILKSYKITGVEPLAAGQPDLRAHETAGITQPVLDFDYSTQAPAATYNASPMADGVVKFATRRMAFWLYRQIIALSAPYHKAFASETNRNSLLSAIDALLERLKKAGRIADYTPTQGDWDAVNSNFTVSVAIDETGNMDVITLRPVFGPSAIADNDLAA